MRAPGGGVVRVVITGVGWAVGDGGGDPVPATAPAGHPPPERGMRHKDRSSRSALRVARRALEDAGLLGAPELDGAAVVVSSNYGNLEAVCDCVTAITTGRSRDISPMRVPQLSSAVAAAWVAIDHGIRGPNLTLCNGASGGLDAVAAARNLIAAGRATAALVIGVEPDAPPVARLHEETGGGRWFDGAVALVVEPLPAAERRGARIRVEIAGYGRAGDERSAVRTAVRAAGTGAGAGAAVRRRLADEPTARFGRCSGALGVMQCALAVESPAGPREDGSRDGPQGESPGASLGASLGGPYDGAVLAVAGAGTGESDGTSVAALVLAPPRGPGRRHP
ncbi:beta-ketoacyl synthase N-terminal-like domain-containing protein [Streptomyces mobaraensis]|uniref:beta-ketoacyl synthase N-terminal-like domain-containing protein n=1 Tax=Streptomyces mobaraensis TaxID=35621 RepID=UPI00332DDAEF